MRTHKSLVLQFIGCLLLEERNIAIYAEVVDDKFIQDAELQYLYRYLISYNREGRVYTPWNLVDYIEQRNKKLKGKYSPSVLVSLAEEITSTTLIDQYARQVIESSQAIELAKTFRNQFTKIGKVDLLNLVEETNGYIQGILGMDRKAEPSFDDIEHRAIENMEKRLRGETADVIDSHLEYFQRTCGGYRKGEIIVIGAQQGTGKSFMGLHLLLGMAQNSRKSLYVNLEMNQQDIHHRIAASVTNRTIGEMSSYSPSAESIQLRKDAQPKMRNLSKYMTITQKNSLAYLDAVLRNAAFTEEPFEVVLIDYLQLMKGEGKSLYDQVTSITRGLNEIALKRQVAVIALSQINREGKKRDEPEVYDLKESSEIENAASSIYLMWPMKDQLEQRIPGKVLIKQVKNRHMQLHPMPNLITFDFARCQIKDITPSY